MTHSHTTEPAGELTALFTKLGIAQPQLLGEGVEARIYALNDQQVVRIYKQHSRAAKQDLIKLQQFYALLSADDADFAVPHIYKIAEQGDILYSIDRRLSGAPLGKQLGAYSPKAAQPLLQKYLQTADAIASLCPPFTSFGEILGQQPVQTTSWPDFLVQKTGQAYATAKTIFDEEITAANMAAVLQFIASEAQAVAAIPTPLLVHGDFNAMNVLALPDGTITAVSDFNDQSVAGDPRMDLASGVIGFLEGEDGMRPADGAFLVAELQRTHGPDIQRAIHLYRVYYAIIFASFCKTSDPRTFAWSIRSLRQHLDGTYTY